MRERKNVKQEKDRTGNTRRQQVMGVMREMSGFSGYAVLLGILVVFGSIYALEYTLGCARSEKSPDDWDALEAKVEKLETKLQECEAHQMECVKMKVELMKKLRPTRAASSSPSSAGKMQAIQEGTKKTDEQPYELKNRIRQVGPNSYQIDRKLVNEIMQNIGEIDPQARVVPKINRKDGKVYGFSISKIKPNSIYSILGIRNGDIIHTINNVDITNPEKALEHYRKLRGSSSLTIKMTRDNKPLTITYKILEKMNEDSPANDE